MAYAGPAEIRRELARLSEEEETVLEAFSEFFSKECPPDRARDAGVLGYDTRLWKQLLDLGGLTMGLPGESGGDGADLIALSLVAEAMGAAAAPVPYLESTVAVRLAAASGADVSDILDLAGAGDTVLTVALHPGSVRQLVPAGAVATHIVALVDGELVLNTLPEMLEHTPNQGWLPLAWCNPAKDGVRRTLARGARAEQLYAVALQEWRLLVAAHLVGIAQTALDHGVEFVKSRTSFGVPLGTFQAVSHKLADIYTAVETTRVLVRKAAWFVTHEPGQRPEMVPMAYRAAIDTATSATRDSTRVQGGLGFTDEASTYVPFRRAKALSVLAGDPHAELLTIGRLAVRSATQDQEV
jgi:alkylation response protein AidB-like acyl-CoA dehydrogenase